MASISIIIPVFRDSDIIRETVEAILAFFRTQSDSLEIILVHDGGPKETTRALQEIQASHPTVQVIERQENRGKGYSIREGLAKASGQILVYTDADLPYALESMSDLIRVIKEERADLAIANRHLHTSPTKDKHHNLIRQITHTSFAWLVKKLFAIPSSDTQAGLKALRRDVALTILPHLIIDRYCFDVELLFLAQRLSFRLHDCPVTLRQKGKSNIRMFKDSWEMLRDLARIWIRRYHL